MAARGAVPAAPLFGRLRHRFTEASERMPQAACRCVRIASSGYTPGRLSGCPSADPLAAAAASFAARTVRRRRRRAIVGTRPMRTASAASTAPAPVMKSPANPAATSGAARPPTTPRSPPLTRRTSS